MPKNYTILLIVALLGLGATCERPVDLDFRGQDPKLAVFSKFTNDKVLEVKVSKGKSVFDSGPTEYILDARVDVFEGDNFIERLMLQPDHIPPVYVSQGLLLRRNSTYTITVEAPGFETVNASSKVPNLVQIDEVEISEILVEMGEEVGETLFTYQVGVTFSDPPDEKNFYYLNFNQEVISLRPEGGGPVDTDIQYQTVIFSSLIDDNYQVAHLEGGVLLDDTPFGGEQVKLTFPLYFKVKQGKQTLGNLLVELAAISEEYYSYFSTLSRQQENPGEPYAEPVFIKSNINNGHGYFAGYTSSLDTIAVIK